MNYIRIIVFAQFFLLGLFCGMLISTIHNKREDKKEPHAQKSERYIYIYTDDEPNHTRTETSRQMDRRMRNSAFYGGEN